MKFGKLLRHTVDSRMPQWRNYTLGYKQLKQHEFENMSPA